LTGQAEAMTLAVAKALLVHEPALKPALRRGELIFFSSLIALPAVVVFGVLFGFFVLVRILVTPRERFTRV
jgi:hypothetical protein